jgi:addiction module HigA family antidote
MSQVVRQHPHSINGSDRAYFGASTSIEFLAKGQTVFRMESGSAPDLTSGPVVVHPGEVLQRDFLEPHRMSANKLATKLGVPPNSILAILHGTRGVSGPMSILLGRAFGVSDEFFATLYSRYQVDVAAQEARQDLTAAQRVARAHALAQELQRGEPSRLP